MTTRLRPADPGYPALLAEIRSPPVLHARGRVEAGDAVAVAIVGARRASAYGLATAERLAADLASRGVTIVSGLARGIDTAAHRGALAAGGRTLAVLGSGLDIVYPPENRPLAAEIERHGAVVSQFPAGTPPLPGNFPARNRTLAGLALGVIVVEGSERSGALITAAMAGDLGREVLAVPGRIGDELSQGPLRLIQDGAKLVRDWADVVQELPEHARRALRVSSTRLRASSPPADSTPEGKVLAVLRDDEPRSIEDVIARSGVSAAAVSAALLSLELAGWARSLPGQRWVRAALAPTTNRRDDE